MLNLLRIRPDESRKALLLILLMLIPSAGSAISSPGIEALFFARVGVRFLPTMYVALGAVTLTASLIITGLLGRIPKKRLYVLLPMVLGLTLFAARLVIALDLAWVYPALWLAMYVMWMLQYLVIWGLAGMVFDTRQAKRLFPLFAAGGILGTAIGGLITRPLVGWVGSENLLFGWALAFFIMRVPMQPLLRGVKEAPTRSRWEQPSFTRDLQRGYQFVRRSELLRWMSAGAFLLGALLFSVIFPFSKAVTAEFKNEDAIAGFLGIFQGITTVVAFLTSLLLANRLFARVGFMGGLLAYPLMYVIGFGTVAIYPAFIAFAALRFMQLVWRLGVFDAAFQAIFNLVPPEHREPARAFLDGVPRQMGVALAGLLLAFGERSLQPTQTYLISAALAAAGLLVFWRARRAYRGALAQALRAGQPHIFFSEEQPFGGFQHDSAAIAVAVNGLSNSDRAIRRVSAEILGNLEVPETTQALVTALDDPDPGVRAALLRSLARAKVPEALLEVVTALSDPEPEVRLEAVQALRSLAGYQRGMLAQIERLLDDPEPAVRSCVAVILLGAGSYPAAGRVLHDMKDSPEPYTRAIVLESIGRWGDQAGFELALDCIDDAHPLVRQKAASALARTDPHRGLPYLIRMLGDEDRIVRATVATQLGKLGPPALDPALEALDDPRLVEGALLALQHLPAWREAPRLRAFAQEKARSAKHHQELWHGVRAIPGGPAFELFAEALQSSARREASQAIRAVGLLADPAAGPLAIENLESRDPGQRANALEMLDSLGEKVLVSPLLGLWDDQNPAEIGEAAPDKWLEQALGDQDPWVRACAALAAGELRDPRLRDQLRLYMNSDPDPLVQETAARSLDGDYAMKALPTLSTMERILFLRRVPLFADLSPDELKQVAAVAGELIFSESDVIARQGEEGDEMYIILAGEVEVTVQGKAGEQEVLARRGPGEYVGEMSIISREPRMASLTASSDVRLLFIGQKEFEGILRERPETSLAVMRVLINRLKESQRVGRS